MDTLYKLFSFHAAAPAVKHHGLYNQGATCYLNSVLQVLFMTREFREAVGRFTDNNPDTKLIDAHLKDLFDDLLRGPTYTDKIIEALKIDSRYEQRDAAEYFEKILNQTSPDAAKIFHGKMAHRTTCTKCLRVDDTDGQFCHLPFELQDSCSGNYSVVDGIGKYFEPSYFRGDNQMYCETCDCKVDASSEYVIKHHPDVLVLLLKRFDFSYRYMSYVKIQCDVDVPYTLNIPEDQMYELYAVVNHYGDLRGGHYAATIKSQDDERWFSFDDSRVSPLDRSPFTDTQNISRFASAYLLFYRKKIVAADIQDKIKPKKRPINANTDENDPKTKKTKQESDTEDQDQNKTLLPNEDQKEIKDPENIELTNINQTPDVLIYVTPGENETSAGRQDDSNGSLGGFRDEEEERRRKDDKKSSNSPEDTTSKDNNQDIHRYLLSSEQVTESTRLEEAELTVVDQIRPDVSHDFNAGDTEKHVSAACDTQNDRSDADRPMMKLNQTEDFDRHGHVTKSKDENTDDQEENTLMFTQTEVTNSETSESTETIPDAETSADKQDNISKPSGVFRDEETERLELDVQESSNTQTEDNKDTDDQDEKLSGKGQNERLVSCERSVECDRRGETRDPQEEGSVQSSTEDQTVVTGPDEAEQTVSNQVTAGVKLSVKPGDSERSPLPAVGKLISSTTEKNKQAETSREQDIKSKHVNTEPQEELNDVETEGTRKQNEAKNSDFHQKNMNWNNSEQEKDKHLLPCDDQNKVTDPENVRLTETEEKKPDVHPEPGDSEASAESHSLKIKTGTDEVKQTENSDKHEGTTPDVIDPVEAKLTEIIQMTQAMMISKKPGDSEGSAGSDEHDTQDGTSNSQRPTMNTTTHNIEQTESSDSHKNQTSKDSDEIKDRNLSSTGEQTVVKEPGEAQVTNITQRNPTHRRLVDVKTDENKPTETSHDQGMESKDRNTGDREENRTLFSIEISPQAEVRNHEESEQIKTVEIKPDNKTGVSKRSTEPVVFNKTRSHEKKRLLDENTDENQITVVSSERTEQNMMTKDDEVNKYLLRDEDQLRRMDVERGAERKPCFKQLKYIIMGTLLAVLLALILLIVCVMKQ